MDTSKYHFRLLLSISRSTNFTPFGHKIHSRKVGTDRIDYFLSHRVFFVKNNVSKNVSRCFIFHIELKKSQYSFFKYNQLELANLFSYQHVFYTDHKNPFPFYISSIIIFNKKKALKLSAFK